VPVSATHWYIMGVNGWYIMGVNAWYIMGVNPWYIIACKLTALPGDITSVFSNCPQCLAQSDAGANLGRLLAQAARTGHDGVSWPDAYDPTSKRAIDMQSGTLWYTIRFLTTYYGVDYDQFMQANPDLISNWDFLQ